MLTVYNDSFQLNVDSHYNNLSLNRKVHKSQMQVIVPSSHRDTFNVPTTNMRIRYNGVGGYRFIPKDPAYVYQIPIPDDIQHPIMAISMFRDRQFSGGVWRDKATGVRYGTVYVPPDVDFTIYLFSSNKTNRENYGLEVFNESGELVFDTENKYMRVMPRIRDDRQCALVLQGAIIGEEMLPDTGTNFVRYLWSFMVKNNDIVPVKYYMSYFYGHYNLWRDALPKPNYDNTPLVIDVTNF